MLSNHPPPNDQDSDWEYEYHDSETETFFLNLDLTTHHGPIRPPRRRNDPSPAEAAAVAAKTTPRPPSVPPSRTDDQDPTIEMDNVPVERVQILGLHTPNPIISYHNQIFSGSWADQLGTELLFSRPELDPQLDPDSTPSHAVPLRHTKDYDLLAANSVKILGRKANLISSSGPGPAAVHTQDSLSQAQQQQQILPSASSSLPPSSSTANTTLITDPPSLVYKPESQTNQARFLERLMNIKKAKGETDTVRTVFSFRRGGNLEDRLRGWARTDEQMALIQRLNERALQGDSDALMELENIYAQLASQDAGPSEGSSRPG